VLYSYILFLKYSLSVYLMGMEALTGIVAVTFALQLKDSSINPSLAVLHSHPSFAAAILISLTTHSIAISTSV
jgi:hypothetical protein